MPPLNLLIKPASSLCNMRCRYCFYADEAQNRSLASTGMMTPETLENLVRQGFAYADGQIGFAFQGGEPTLVGLPFYEKLIRLQNRYNTKGIRVTNSIQTNGLLIDDDWAAFFARNHFLVGVSFDGTRQLQDNQRPDANGAGTFDRVSRAIRLLQRHGAEFNILCVVNDYTARHPVKVYEALKKYGYLQFIPCLDGLDGTTADFSLKEDRYADFLQQTFDCYYRDYMQGSYVSVRNFDNYISILLGNPPENCGMNGFCSCYGVIEGDGSIYPCDFYVLDEWKLGNIHTDLLQDVLTGEKAKTFVRRSLPVPEECKGCNFYKLCRNGCTRERRLDASDQPGLNRHCKAFQAFFSAKLPQMLQLARAVRYGTPQNS